MDSTTIRRVGRVAAEELERAMRRMRIPGHPKPHYLSYLIRDEETWRVQARYGALVTDGHERSRNAFVDVRVGTWRSDQVRDGGLDDNDKEDESYGYVDLPFGEDPSGLRFGLWRLTDARYREAVEALLDKRSHELTYVDANRHLAALRRRAPVVQSTLGELPAVDRDAWRDYVARASRVLRRYDDVKDSNVEFRAEHVVRIFVNSEGSRIVQSESIWSVECYLWLIAPSGDAFPWTVTHIVADPAELPDVRSFQREIRATVAKLRRLAAAPVLRSFVGPALLEPLPAGLLLHEAVGHRLEGNRLLASGEGQTFKDAVGRTILPPFLSLRDDPSLARWDGRSLVGHYRFDDEGTPTANAALIEDGVLRGYLTTRTGIAGGHRSTGHARARYHQRPISRMGVLIAEARNGCDDGELKARLLAEIRRQKAPFGLRIIEATSGETATDAYNFQAFLGEINLAARVYPDGREEWIRGVNFVGTPLNAVRSIVAAGSRLEVDNAFCGAESGYVPVTTISPALVVSELELQSKPESPYAPYSYPIPWAR